MEETEFWEKCKAFHMVSFLWRTAHDLFFKAVYIQHVKSGLHLWLTCAYTELPLQHTHLWQPHIRTHARLHAFLSSLHFFVLGDVDALEDLQSCRTALEPWRESLRERKWHRTENMHASMRIKHAKCVEGICTVRAMTLSTERRSETILCIIIQCQTNSWIMR